MSTFDELHPRGQAHNAGQFREKENAAPTGALTADEDTPGNASEAEEQPFGAAWTILRDRVGDFAAAVDKANKRLERNGVDERFNYETSDWVWRDEHDRPWMVTDVKLNRPSISSGPWRFLAQHQSTPGGGIITYATRGGEDVIADGMRCDHCGKTRARQKVFTVEHRETGERQQIGSSCVDLFLGVRPEGLWAMSAEVGAELKFDEDEAHRSVSGTPNAIDGDQLMLATMRQIEADGKWLSRSKAGMYDTPTIDKVLPNLDALTSEARPVTPEEQAELDGLRTYLEDLASQATDPADISSQASYVRNLLAGFTRDEEDRLIVYRKHAALVASALSSYRTHLEREAERSARAKAERVKLAEFALPIGEKLAPHKLELTVLAIRDGVDYGYGAPQHVTMIDDAGHVFYWKASGIVGQHLEFDDVPDASWHWLPQAGSRVAVAGGTVKDHRVSDYNGDHETVLQRVKLAPTAEARETLNAEARASAAARRAAIAERERAAVTA